MLLRLFGVMYVKVTKGTKEFKSLGIYRHSSYRHLHQNLLSIVFWYFESWHIFLGSCCFSSPALSFLNLIPLNQYCLFYSYTKLIDKRDGYVHLVKLVNSCFLSVLHFLFRIGLNDSLSSPLFHDLSGRAAFPVSRVIRLITLKCKQRKVVCLWNRWTVINHISA